MGKTFSTGLLTNGIWQDASNNIGIGGSPSGSYKLEVTGNGKFTSASFPLDVYGTTNNYGLRINNVQAATLFLYSSNANADSRNWGLFTNSEVYGDFDIRQSNAINGDLTNGANSTSRFYIKNNGNVAIGSTTANYLLDVNKTVAGDFIARILNSSATGYGLYVQTNDNSKPAIRIANSSGVATIDLKAQASQVAISNGGTAQEASFRATMSWADGYRAALYLNNTHTGGAEYYIVSTNNSDGIWGGGKLAISGNNGTNGVYLNGVTATAWTGQSDIRLKDIDSEIENAIDKVNKLRGVRFTWKSDETKKMQVGLIAQEVKEVLPEAVDFDETNEDYRMGVQYTDLIPLLVNAIKELSAQNQDLKSRLDKAGL